VTRRFAATLLLVVGCAAEQPEGPSELAPDPRVEATIEEMASRYASLLADCDHKGLFALAYKATTEEYLRAATEPGFFRDPGYLDDEDTLFARYYFDHVDNWTAGRAERVPAAWRLSFQSSDDRSVTTLGDVLLGISAHINQDLPYVIAELGVTDERGRSRKGDHDQVNVFLARVAFDDEIRANWDPAYDVAYTSGLATIESWRASAWESALALVAATTPEDRSKIDAAIAENAESAGKLIAGVTAYNAGDSAEARDAFCAGR
jgi:hypothetical protein